MWRVGSLGGFLLLLSILIFLPWKDREAENAFLQKTYSEMLQKNPSLVPVITFNMRLDCEESNEENHFRRRVFRLSKFFNETKPWLVGLQEPFSGQLLHLQSLLPSHYQPLGNERNEKIDRADPKRMSDYQTSILYDTNNLELVAHDHFWLSKNPHVPLSKSWGSIGSRTVTIGAFRKKEYFEKGHNRFCPP